MFRGLGVNLRGKRTQAAILLFFVIIIVLFLQLPPGQGVNLPPDTRPHTGLLVTTPNDEQHPLRYLPLRADDTGGITLGDALPIRTGISPGSKQGVSHIIRHPGHGDLVYITNEVRPGSIWTGKLERLSSRGVELGIFGQNPSNGDLPSHAAVTRDGKHLIVTNYDSPTVSVHSIGVNGRLQHVQTITLPKPSGVLIDAQSHLHHVIQHTSDSVFYVVDLGREAIYVLRLSDSSSRSTVHIVQTFDVSSYGSGPRNGVVSTDGLTYYLSFQTSSSVIALPLDRRRMLQTPTSPGLSTLPDDILDEGIATSDGQPIHSASDIHLFNDLLLVANRRVKGPYPKYTGENEDTIAIFMTNHGRITRRGHVSTGCWKPREMMRVRGDRQDYLAVTCNGQFAQGGGVVLIDLNEPYRVVGRWDSHQLSPSGIVGLSIDMGSDNVA